MKIKALALILGLGCVLLAGVLWFRHTASLEAETRLQDSTLTFSNQWTEATGQLTAQREERVKIEQEVTKWTREALTLSNDLSVTTATLEKTRTEARAAAAAVETAQAAVRERDGKIQALSSERDTAIRDAGQLKQTIAGLESSLAEMNRKLSASEGDRDFMIAEMKRLQADKAEWERQFHDLEALREQVRIVHSEEVTARRRDWMQRGIIGSSRKGAELLQTSLTPAKSREATAAPPPITDLDVELSRDGAVRMETNAPPASR